MKLSEAIRLGSMMKPQAFGRIRHMRLKRLFGWLPLPAPESASCALGAAIDAGGIGCKVVPVVPGSISRPFRGNATAHKTATTTVVDFPREWLNVLWVVAPCPMGCGHAADDVDRMIAHLNDDHRWTRERIADWVESIERAQDVNDAACVAVEVRTEQETATASVAHSAPK